MSNYPDHHGKYERTELHKTKTALTFARKRLAQAERDVHELETKIENLQKESN